MRTMTVLTVTTLLALGTMAPAGATYDGQVGRIAFGAFVAADPNPGRHLVGPTRRAGSASASRRPRPGHLPRLLRRREATSRSVVTGPAPTRSG